MKHKSTGSIQYAKVLPAIVVGVILAVAMAIISVRSRASTSLTQAVPLILDSSCTHWVNQYGDLVPIEYADHYFAEHKEIAQRVLALNLNPRYASRLCSLKRMRFLHEKAQLWAESWGEAAPNVEDTLHSDPGKFQQIAVSTGALRDSGDIYRSAVAFNTPSIQALDLLSEHVSGDFDAKATISHMRFSCGSTTRGVYPFDELESNINAAFFACLAKISENQTIDELCPQPEDIAPMPLVLTADGVWHDQNGKAMSTEAAHAWFEENPVIGERIVNYNANTNPYLVESAAIHAEFQECYALTATGLDPEQTLFELAYPDLANAMLANVADDAEVKATFEAIGDDVNVRATRSRYYESLHFGCRALNLALTSEDCQMYGVCDTLGTAGYDAAIYVLALCNTYQEANAILEELPPEEPAHRMPKKQQKDPRS